MTRRRVKRAEFVEAEGIYQRIYESRHIAGVGLMMIGILTNNEKTNEAMVNVIFFFACLDFYSFTINYQL